MSEESVAQNHWNRVYHNTETEKTGWYENIPVKSLELIEECRLEKNARLFNAGAGATTLVDELLKLGYENIVANDISKVSLEGLKARLGEKAGMVEWVIDDLVNPEHLHKLEPVDLWHDRAVLHFFITKEGQDAYFSLLNKLVKKSGYVIIAVFNLDGATKCSGLPVYRYNAEMLAEKLGNDFDLVKDFNHTYTMPSGDTREYIYTLFKRKK